MAAFLLVSSSGRKQVLGMVTGLFVVIGGGPVRGDARALHNGTQSSLSLVWAAGRVLREGRGGGVIARRAEDDDVSGPGHPGERGGGGGGG